MDVGVRGGYFDEKSPKLLLAEWCQRAKRPHPRYVPQQAGGGAWGCKVVVPDAKGVADRDLIVWLDSSLSARDAEEAAQRGAVAALHAVQGDRALDYVLPSRYRVVWRELCEKVGPRKGRVGGGGRRRRAEPLGCWALGLAGVVARLGARAWRFAAARPAIPRPRRPRGPEQPRGPAQPRDLPTPRPSAAQATQREAKRAAAAEKTAQKRERAAARKAAAERRGAATVVMSEEQRARIEALLRGLDASIGAGLPGLSGDWEGAGSSDEDDEDDGGEGEGEPDPAAAAEAAALARELRGLGFEEGDAAAAVRAVGGGGAGLAAALDWLCLSLPEERLPRAFGPGGRRPWGVGVGWGGVRGPWLSVRAGGGGQRGRGCRCHRRARLA
jgi:hypothetical protein